MRSLKDLGLKGNPFQVSPTDEYAKIWADRKNVYKKISLLLELMTSDSPSEILLIWGQRGAGKTHAMKHFAYKLANEKKALIVFTDLTACSAKSFFDLYCEFMRDLDPYALHEAVKGLSITKKSKLSVNRLRLIIHENWIEFLRAMLSISKDQYTNDVMEWLQGETVSGDVKKNIGVKRKISDDSKALRALAGTIKILQTKYTFAGWFMDEYQTLYDLLERRRFRGFENIERGLINLYNRCPSGFIFGFSFTCQQREAILKMLPEAFLRRASSIEPELSQCVVDFPLMDVTEGLEFVSDLLRFFHLQRFKNEYHPFTKEAVQKIILNIYDHKKTIVPRWINISMKKALDAIRESKLQLPVGESDLHSLGIL